MYMCEKLKFLSIFPTEGVSHQDIEYNTHYTFMECKILFHFAYGFSFENWLGEIGKNGQAVLNKCSKQVMVIFEIDDRTQIVNYLCKEGENS